MSKTWNEKEIQAASKAMKKAGHMSYEEFCEEMNKQEKMMYWRFLEDLRRSGVTNMFGAVPYLMEAFYLDEYKAREILSDWMKNYNPKDYE